MFISRVFPRPFSFFFTIVCHNHNPVDSLFGSMNLRSLPSRHENRCQIFPEVVKGRKFYDYLLTSDLVGSVNFLNFFSACCVA